MRPRTAATFPVAKRETALTLRSHARAVGEARRHLRAVLDAWRCPHDRYTAILLTSELVTNAVTHGGPPDATVTLLVRLIDERLVVEVHDRGHGEPARCTPAAGPSSESGRGLEVVRALADEWGTRWVGDGKYVYFVLEADHEPACDEFLDAAPPSPVTSLYMAVPRAKQRRGA